MQATLSPDKPRFVRVPFPIPVLAIYFGLIVLSEIPSVTHQQFFVDNYFWATPFIAAEILADVAIFVAAFVLNDFRALLVPIAGSILATLIYRYAAQFPVGLSNTAQPGFASVVWHALKFEAPSGIVVAGFGWLTAQHWAPRAGIDGEPSEFGGERKLALMPPPREVVVLFFVFFALTTLFDIIGPVHFHGYLGSQLYLAVTALSKVVLFLAVFSVNRWWSVVFPALFLAESVLVLGTQYGGCGGFFNCLSHTGWFTFKYALPTFLIVFFISLLCAQWARPSDDA